MAKKKKVLSNKINLRLITFNVMMLPSGKKKHIRRARRIVAALLDGGYDIVCLQELFDEDVRDEFVDGLKPFLPHIVKKCDDGNWFRQDSGLFIASKYPIMNHLFEAYWEYAGTDGLAEKGISMFRLNLNSLIEGVSLVVFNTHMQSDKHLGENEAVRRRQLRQVRNMFRQCFCLKDNLDTTGAVFMGDLNIEGDSPEYHRMIEQLGSIRDLYRIKNPRFKGYTWDYKVNDMIHHKNREQLRLDYIFAVDKAPDTSGKNLRKITCNASKVQKFRRPNGKCLSDHFAVEASITI